jgi:thiamine-phosphate pyrophosphorylase
MTRRHKKPMGNDAIARIWLMTDPRLGGNLSGIVRGLPARSGVIFRHYDLEPAARLALLRRIRRVCRQRGHKLLLAGLGGLPETGQREIGLKFWHVDGVHGGGAAHGMGIISVPVHNAREIARARRSNADMMLLSPLFATRSHPGQRPLGLFQFHRLAKLCGPAKIIALGGMTRQKAAMLPHHSIHGWAAIDTFGEK